MIDKWGRSTDDYPRVREYYADKTIFLTGGSGFIGKVLIEKLLRCSPAIRKIYLLLRPKRGLSVKQRLDKIFSVPLFDKLDKESGGTWRKKIQIINGDVMELNMGISEEDESILVEEVNIFYHNAASVRFDDSLKKAIIMNTRGTREACNLAVKMKRIEMFFHVSTTYCNIHQKEVREELYPPVADWNQMIYLAENMDEQQLQVVSTKLMDQFPNTYTFTKNLAEHVVNDFCDGKVPAIIIRPSIVISTFDDPFPGWIDNFNGPAGMMVGCGKGVLRVNWANADVRMDYVPADYLVKAMVGLVGYRLTREDEDERKKLEVYNASADLNYAITTRQTIELGRTLVDDYPLSNPLWYPGGDMTSSKTYYFIQIIFIHLLPALLIDLLLKLTGNKPMLFKIQKKVYVANSALHYFINQEWPFINEKLLKMRLEMRKEDHDEFHVELDVDHSEYFKKAILGGKQYLLHEDLKDLDKHRRRMFQMKILHYAFKLGVWLLMLRFVYSHLYFTNYLWGGVVNYYRRLEV